MPVRYIAHGSLQDVQTVGELFGDLRYRQNLNPCSGEKDRQGEPAREIEYPGEGLQILGIES